MGFFDRLGRLFRANANAALSAAEDPGLILDQAVADMQDNLVKLRQAVATAIASQKRLQNQFEEADKSAIEWQQRAQLALQKGNEELARQALQQKKAKADSAAMLKVSLESQSSQVETLKKSLLALEGKIAEAKSRKDMLKARGEAAKAQEQLQGVLSGVSTEGAMAAFERMEEKVLNMEARGQALAELSGSDLESQFAQLDAGSIDDELAALKASLSGTAGTLPPASTAPALAPADASNSDPIDVLFSERASAG